MQRKNSVDVYQWCDFKKRSPGMKVLYKTYEFKK